MNLPNKLTVSRLLLTVCFVIALTLDQVLPLAHSLAALFFIVAAITDWLDGYLARKYHLITSFGKLMDPLADKVLMCAGFVMLSDLHLIPGWMVVAILTREFLVTGLRLVASAEGVVLAAESLGKHKTIWQVITLIYFLIYLARDEPLFAWMDFLYHLKVTGIAITGVFLLWLTLALTVVSGLSYAWKNRKLLADC